MFEWREIFDDSEWDTIVSLLRGHPLQSATWGNSKKLIDQIYDIRLAAFKDGAPVYIVRLEIRYFLKKIKIAWIPRGPVVLDEEHEFFLHTEFLQRLKKMGFFFCIEAPWKKLQKDIDLSSNFFTIWVDLQLGQDQLWKNLHKQFRYDIKRAKKLGVCVQKTHSAADIPLFYEACKKLSSQKNFNFPASYELMLNLLETRSPIIETLLFIARYEDNFCGGALIIRCGQHIHYMWGAVDRQFSHLSVGQALQWEVIEWGLSKNCTRYDLEGITSKKNSGVDNFKKKIGGELVANPGIQIYAFNIITKFCSRFFKLYLFFNRILHKT